MTVAPPHHFDAGTASEAGVSSAHATSWRAWAPGGELIAQSRQLALVRELRG